MINRLKRGERLRVLLFACISCLMIAGCFALLVQSYANAEGTIIAEGDCGESVHWVIYSDGLLLISGEGAMYDQPNISEALDETEREGVRKLVIEDGVTTIGASAFVNMASLVEANLGNTITKIDSRAFNYCKALVSITIPSGVTEIGANALDWCSSLGSVVLPEGLTNLGANAFRNCLSLSSVNIPSTISKISSLTFYKCEALRRITIPSSVTIIDSYAFDGCVALKEIEIQGCLTQIGKYAARGCSSLENVTYEGIILPEKIGAGNDKLVNLIRSCNSHLAYADGKCGENAYWRLFENGTLIVSGEGEIESFISKITSANKDKIKYIEIEGVNAIPKKAFYSLSSVKKVTFSGDTVASIGPYAFGWCTSLNEVNLPSSLKSIGDYAFEDCSSISVVSYKGDNLAGISFGIGNEAILDILCVDHVETIDPAKEPTCTTVGYTEGSHCSICNKVIRIQNEIPALGHATVIDEATVTCEKNGYTQGSHCSKCSEVIVEQEYVDALGHAWNEGVVEKEATCVLSGSRLRTCDRCKKTIHEMIPAKGHQEVKDPAKSPTCISAGLSEGSHCSVCGKVIVAQKKTENALGHSWDGGYVKKAATCSETGIRVLGCRRCQETKEELIEKKEHSVVTDPAKSPTCTEEGCTEGSHCSVCGTVIKEQELVKKLDHALAVLPAVAATCTENGLSAGTYCTLCGEVVTKRKTVNALGHRFVTVPAVAATYTKTGLTSGERCSVCGYVSKEQMKTPMLEGAVVKNGKTYFYKNGTTQKGWITIDSQTFYFGSEGYMLTGWKRINNKWYCFNSKGVMQTGWKKSGTKWYYLNPGSGEMKTGWIKPSGKYYYLNPDGSMQTGWKQIDKEWYYFGTDGIMVTGKKAIGGKTYTFNSNGVWNRGKGSWKYVSTSVYPYYKYWYRFTDGTYPKNEWVKIGGSWYYFNSDGYLHTGWKKYNGKWYFFKSTEELNFPKEDPWYNYWSDPLYLIGVGYGQMVSLCRVSIDGRYYAFDVDGVMKTGWIIDEETHTHWYSNSDGTVATGWKKISGKWYYFYPGLEYDGEYYGVAICGLVELDGKQYYFDVYDMSMHTGWTKIDGDWYYFNSSGVMQTGLKTIGGKKYYFDPDDGVMLTDDWVRISGKEYYFTSSGAMAGGWTTIEGKKYYFTSGSEYITSDWVEIDGVLCLFDRDGVWLEPQTFRSEEAMSTSMAGFWKRGSYNYYFDGNYCYEEYHSGMYERKNVKYDPTQGLFTVETYFSDGHTLLSTDQYLVLKGGNEYVDVKATFAIYEKGAYGNPSIPQ